MDPRIELADIVADLHDLLRADAERGIDHRLGEVVEAQPRQERRPEPQRSAPRAPRQQAPRPTRRPDPPRKTAPQPAAGARHSSWGKKQEPTFGYEHAVGAWGFTTPPPIPEGSPARAAADRLLAVRRELGACQRCRLCEGRRSLVFGMGHPDADLVILGEGPGANEDRDGLPFVGAAGQMLDNMLKHVLGLTRDQVYILNVVKCRPPNNRNPQPDEVAACRPFLLGQLQAIRPKVILTLGSPAVKTLLETTRGIMSMRGRWQAWEGVPVMPTLHPAYLLRKPEDKRLTFDDLKALRARYDHLGGRR